MGDFFIFYFVEITCILLLEAIMFKYLIYLIGGIVLPTPVTPYSIFKSKTID